MSLPVFAQRIETAMLPAPRGQCRGFPPAADDRSRLAAGAIIGDSIGYSIGRRYGMSLFERLGQWPTEILGSSETGGIAWRQGQHLWQPFADVQLSQSEDGALIW